VLGGGLAPVVATAPRIEVRVQEDLGDFSSTVIEEVGGRGWEDWRREAVAHKKVPKKILKLRTCKIR
jgi:hypothetical protein